MKARLTGGLVAAALAGAGLAFPASATAADTHGFPHQLGFEPDRLVATGEAVYAAGSNADPGELGEVSVTTVGGGRVVVATDSYLLDMVTLPGPTHLVVTSDGDGEQTLTEVYPNGNTNRSPVTRNVEVLGTDSAGSYFSVVQGGGGTLVLSTSYRDVTLASDATAQSAAATGPATDRTWSVAGSQWDSEGGATATLWSHEQNAGVTAVSLGAPGHPDQYALDVAADPSGDAVYALTFRDNADAPQSYGLTVVQDGADTYLPLSGTASEIELSPDGRTLYLAQSDSVLALATDDLDELADESGATGVSVDARVTALAVDSAGHVFAGSTDGMVHGYAAPAAPQDLTAAAEPMSTTAFSASWDEGRYAGELDGGQPEYAYTVRSGGQVVATGSTFDQVVVVDDLQPGTTYTLEVTASNGLLTSEAGTAQVTTHGRYVDAPSAVAVQGDLTVGGQLSLANTGSWEDGATLTYEWYGSKGEMGGAIGAGPTLALTADHVGMRITGVVTGTKAGVAGVTLSASASGTVSSPPVVAPPVVAPPVVAPPVVAPPVVAPPAVTPGKLTAPKPQVTGRAKVGRTLTVRTGSWTVGTKLTYTWSANGKPIKGADDRTLTLTRSLKGKRISVEVTGTKAGYTTVTRESAQTGKIRR